MKARTASKKSRISEKEIHSLLNQTRSFSSGELDAEAAATQPPRKKAYIATNEFTDTPNDVAPTAPAPISPSIVMLTNIEYLASQTDQAIMATKPSREDLAGMLADLAESAPVKTAETETLNCISMDIEVEEVVTSKPAVESRPFIFNFFGYQKSTSLHTAISNLEYAEAERLLQEKKCPVDYYNSDGHTALHLAVLKGDLKLVSLLLKHGADMSATVAHWHESPFFMTKRVPNGNAIFNLMMDHSYQVYQQYYQTLPAKDKMAF